MVLRSRSKPLKVNIFKVKSGFKSILVELLITQGFRYLRFEHIRNISLIFKERYKDAFEARKLPAPYSLMLTYLWVIIQSHHLSVNKNGFEVVWRRFHLAPKLKYLTNSLARISYLGLQSTSRIIDETLTKICWSLGLKEWNAHMFYMVSLIQ